MLAHDTLNNCRSVTILRILPKICENLPKFIRFFINKFTLVSENRNASHVPAKCCNLPTKKTSKAASASYESSQGRSQPHSPGWARVPLSSFFLKFWSIFLIFRQTLLIFFPHFGSPGGRVAHPGRPWLRHWKQQRYLKSKLVWS